MDKKRFKPLPGAIRPRNVPDDAIDRFASGAIGGSPAVVAPQQPAVAPAQPAEPAQGVPATPPAAPEPALEVPTQAATTPAQVPPAATVTVSPTAKPSNSQEPAVVHRSAEVLFNKARARDNGQDHRFMLRTTARQQAAVDEYFDLYSDERESRHNFLIRALFRGLLLPLNGDQEDLLDTVFRQYRGKGGTLTREQFFVEVFMKGAQSYM